MSEEDWQECRRSALEMTLATGVTVSPRTVALEFAQARAFEDVVVPQLP